MTVGVAMGGGRQPVLPNSDPQITSQNGVCGMYLPIQCPTHTRFPFRQNLCTFVCANLTLRGSLWSQTLQRRCLHLPFYFREHRKFEKSSLFTLVFLEHCIFMRSCPHLLFYAFSPFKLIGLEINQVMRIKGREMALVWHEEVSRIAMQTSSVNLTRTLFWYRHTT